MPRRKKVDTPATPALPPAKVPEEREKQLISLAEAEAERMMREHTAPAQIVVHYLKLGTTREALEQEKIRRETELAVAKVKSTESIDQLRNMMTEAVAAFRSYSGNQEEDSFDAID